MTVKSKEGSTLSAKSLHDSAFKKLQAANAAASFAAKNKQSADCGFTPQAIGLTLAEWNALAPGSKLVLANEFVQRRRAELEAKAELERQRTLVQ